MNASRYLTVLTLVAVVVQGCHRATTGCYRCIDTHQVDATFDVCQNDTTAAGRNAYSTLSAGGHINNTNGAPDSCIFFTR